VIQTSGKCPKFSVLCEVLTLSSDNMFLLFNITQHIMKSLGGYISEKGTDDHSSEYIKRIMNTDIDSGIAYEKCKYQDGNSQ
jgi:hypothetical protein